MAMGQGGKSPSRGLTHVGLAAVPFLPSKQVLSREPSCTHAENSRPLSPATNLPQPRKTQSSSKHLTQGDFLSLPLCLFLPYRDNLGTTCSGRRGWAQSSASPRHIFYQ